MPRRSLTCILVAGLLLVALSLAACGSLAGTGPLPLPTSQAPSPTQPAGDIPPTAEPGSETPVPPTAAPAGLHVTFIQGENAWLWREGAQAAPLTKDGGVSNVKISPDGRVVAFERGGELWAVNTDGTQERRLVSAADLSKLIADGPNVAIFQFAWQPGSHKLAYNTRKVYDAPGLTLNNDLHLVDADSQAKSTLLAPGQGGNFNYSPDGKRIAIVTPDKISLINADGTGRQDGVLTYAPVATYSELVYYVSPVWAADSSYLVVAIPPADSLAQPPQDTTVWRIPTDGTASTPIATVRSMNWRQLAISPDLTHIAYLQQAEGTPTEAGPQSALAITTLGKDETVSYAQEAQVIDGWAPDSQHLAFVVGAPQQQQTMIGQLGTEAIPASDPSTAINTEVQGEWTGVLVSSLRWVDGGRYLFLLPKPKSEGWGIDWNIVLREIGGTNDVVATVAGDSPPVYDLAR